MRSLYHFLLAFFGNLFYGAPSKKLVVIGVTGTKGKSTTLELLNCALEKFGEKTALLSSVRQKIGEKSAPNTTGNTMPGRFAIQKFLKNAVVAKCSYALIEVTSEGVLQHRHQFISWDMAVFTNLTREHIERHGSFEAYRSAKVAFFEYLKQSKKKNRFAIINSEDKNAAFFESAVRGAPGITVVSFSPRNIFKGEERIKNEWLKISFNMENAASAAVCARVFGVPVSLSQQAFESFRGLSGRMEFVQREPFAVVVDYAHTPDSLRAVYETLLATGHKTRLICVLGSCGGGRDIWKRPVMGEIAGEYCSEIILTNEDPFDENELEITKAIEEGVNRKKTKRSNIRTIIDRGEAIQESIKNATHGDTVIITGKGSEQWIRVARGKKIPWSDKKTVLKFLEK